MLKAKRYMFFFLILGLIIAFTKQETLIENLILNNINGSEFFFDDVESNLYNITGKIDNSKKYILITAVDLLNKNNAPFLFIRKFEDFTNREEYDYTSIDEFSLSETKLVLPQYYFNSQNKSGFYMNITCKNDCYNLYLKFEYVNSIDLTVDQKFSYYSREEEINEFNITVLHPIDFWSNSTRIAYIINGGDSKQLFLKTSSKDAEKALPDAYFVLSDPTEDDGKVFIKVDKNVKFNFKTEYFDVEDEINIKNRNIYEGEYNQLFLVKGNRKECFNVISLDGEVSNDKREITIVGKKQFNVYLTCTERGESSQINFKAEENEKYVATNGLYCKSTVEEICITSLQPGISMVKIHVHKKVKEFSPFENENLKPRKMDEPLLSGIVYKYKLNQENSKTTDNEHINLHTHSQFLERNSNNSQAVGFNVGIKLLYGKIKVYKDLCIDFPYCSFNREYLNNSIINEDSRSNFQSLDSSGGYFETTIEAIQDSYSMSTFQSTIAVVCQENNKDGCSYQIIYYPIQKRKKLNSGSMITKYLSPYQVINKLNLEDNYTIFLHKNKKTVIDLVVYSGDAYILLDKNIVNCTFEEHHLGSNERRIAMCDNSSYINKTNEEDSIKMQFKVRAGRFGAVYSIYALEKDKNSFLDEWPMEMTIMESIHDDSRKVKILGKVFDDPPSGSNSKFVTIFNMINCNLTITNLNSSNEYTSEIGDIIQDETRASKKMDLFFEIKKSGDSHRENKNCLYYVNSFDSNNDDSFFIIPEAKPFRFKLDYDRRKVSASFLYANTEEKPEVFLIINLINTVPIKMKVKIGRFEEVEYNIFQSKILSIINERIKGLRKNNSVKIKILIELYNKYDNAVIDFSIKTNGDIPYSLKTEEILNDATNKNDLQYYMTLLNKNSKSEVTVNFKRGSGYIYGKLFNEKDKKVEGGWNNRFLLPTNKTKNLLPFDFYKQKLIINKNQTKVCDNYCYLIFAVEPVNNYNFYSNELLLPYSLYVRNIDQSEQDFDFVKLKNNVYISNKINGNYSDYFKYSPNKDEDETNKIIINFESEHCEMIIGFDTKDFDKSKKVKKIVNNNSSDTYFELTKEEILSDNFKNGNSTISLSSLTFYIKVSKKNKNKTSGIENIDSSYKLRINTPMIPLEKIQKIDGDHPVSCTFTNNKRYCDYLMTLDSYDFISDVEIFAVGPSQKNLKLYGRLVNTNDFGQTIMNGSINSWATRSNHSFPGLNEEEGSYIKINSSRILNKGGRAREQYIQLRIYGKEGTAKLFTSLSSLNEEIPSPNNNRLFSIKNNKSLVLNMPIESDYICHFVPLSGKGSIDLKNENITLFGDYDPIIINSNRNRTENKIKIINPEITNSSENNNKFIFYMWYNKEFANNNLEELSFGSSSFAYKDKNFPFKYYIQINNISNSLSFNIFFESLKNKGNKNSNNNDIVKGETEDFKIYGYLITEDELISLKINNETKLNQSTKTEGSYEFTHHYGNIIFDEKKIKNYTNNYGKNGTKLFAYIAIEKPSLNNYSYLKGKISVIFPENYIAAVHADTYIMGLIKPSKNSTKNIYKLNLLSLGNSPYAKIEFSSISKNITYKLLTSNFTEIKEKDKKVMHLMDKLGKDISLISNNESEAYIEVFSPPINYSSEYTFKYSGIYSQDIKYNVSQKSEIISKNITAPENKTTLTIYKIKINNETKNCNYYIRTFYNKKENDTFNNTVSIRKDPPYKVFKIEGQNKDVKDSNDTISVEIKGVKYEKNMYFDVIAEDKESKELYGYEKHYPSFKPSDGNSKDNSLLYKIIIIILIFLLIVLILVLVFCCINNKRKKKGNQETDNDDESGDLDKDDDEGEEEEDEDDKQKSGNNDEYYAGGDNGLN